MPIEVSKLKSEDDALADKIYQFLKKHKGLGYTKEELSNELGESKLRIGDVLSTFIWEKANLKLYEHEGVNHYYIK